MRKRLLMIVGVFAMLACAIPAQAIKVYFNNGANWPAVSAYFFTDSSNNNWPGVAMTKAAGETLWSVDVPEAYLNGKFIANNNNNGSQYPAAGGLQLAGKSMILAYDSSTPTQSIWTEYEDAAFKVYFDNSYANWSAVKIYYWGETGSGEWDAPKTMTKVEGSDDIYEYEVPKGTAGLIFRDGGSNQSGNLAAKKNHVYSNTADLGVYTPQTVTATPFDVYFDNKLTGWATPYIYYWGGASSNQYPGTAMTAVAGKDGIYKYTVPARTTKILFNAGDGDASKTTDFNALEDHVYTQAGDTGATIDDYVRTVEKPATLFLLTNNGTEPMNPNVATAMTANGNKFIVNDVKIEPSTVGGTIGYFTFVTAKGATWDIVNGSDRYGAATENATLTDGKAAVVKYAKGASAGSAKSWIIEQGTYSFSVDFETMEVTVSGNAIVAGTGSISVPAVEVAAGSDNALEFKLNTESSIVAMQLDIALPEQVLASAPRLSEVFGSPASHTIEANTVNGKYRVIIRSNTNAAFPASVANNGVVFTLPFSALSTAAAGEYEISVSNIILSDANLMKVTLEAGEMGKIKITQAAASTIKLNKEEVALLIGGSETLVATNNDDEALVGVVWKSSNTDVATVDQTGKVTAVANGTAVISATHGTAKATCNVTVGKKAQEITWDQPLEEHYAVGANIVLTATSDNTTIPVTFAITNGSGYATLAEADGVWTLTTTAAGVVTVQARQAGDEDYAPANPVTRNITVWLGFYPGDVNGDDKLTVADATATVDYILGKNPTPFDSSRADLNNDGEIDIVDVTLITSLILKATPTGGSAAPRREAAEGLESFMIEKAGAFDYHISFTNMENYVSTQFDLILPEGVEIASATMSGSSHKVSFAKVVGNLSRVVILSEWNNNFHPEGYANISFNKPIDSSFLLQNALIDRIEGNSIIETPANGASSATTGVATIATDSSLCEVYTVDGICVFRGNLNDFRAENLKGVYMVRKAGKTQKVVF